MGIKTVLSCDHIDCTNEQAFDGPYHIIKDEMKEEGWVNHKVGENWEIKCPDHNPYRRK